MQRKLVDSLKVCHTFKVGSRLSPDTFWVCFPAGESLKEPESDSYGFVMAQRKTPKVITQNWILRKERVLTSTRMWVRKRRKRTMYRKKASRKQNWFQVRIWIIV
jgi:hypothetical protein